MQFAVNETAEVIRDSDEDTLPSIGLINASTKSLSTPTDSNIAPDDPSLTPDGPSVKLDQQLQKFNGLHICQQQLMKSNQL